MISPSRTQLIFLYSIVITLSALLVYLVLPPQEPTSPLAHTQSSQAQTTPSPQYQILGFLPYWNLKKLTSESQTSITQLAYFALHLNSSGKLVKLESAGIEDPGYTNYKRVLDLAPTNLTLTFMPYDQEALTDILNNRFNRQTAINTITDLIKESGATGVNIDFEPTSSVPPSLRDNFTFFINELSPLLTSTNLSISIYPSAASRPRLWDLAALAPSTDLFVIMTYDYHLPTSPKSGPNAPIRGAGTLFEHDILTNLAEITQIVPPSQLLLGIPFYGYEWSTDSYEKYAPSPERGSVASLERIQQLIEENTLELLWDRNSLTPYAIRRDDGEIISQIYFESIDSIRLKLDLVKSAGLGGIAIWALGYEGYNPELWTTIRSLNTP